MYMQDIKYTNKEDIDNENMIDYKAVSQDIKENGKVKMMESMMKKQNKSRINAYISKKNYDFINDLMTNGELICMKLSKGAILDLALTNLSISLECGEALETIAINHLERGD